MGGRRELTVNVAAYLAASRVNGPGRRAVVWVQGCRRRCEGCCNRELQEFREAERVTVEELAGRVLADETLAGATISGGEPFEQAEALAEVARRVREAGKTVIVFTGYALEELKRAGRRDWAALLAETDVLIDGPYHEQEQTHASLRASANQRWHFLSGRITPEEMAAAPQGSEVVVTPEGVAVTGVVSPELREALRRGLGG